MGSNPIKSTKLQGRRRVVAGYLGKVAVLVRPQIP